MWHFLKSILIPSFIVWQNDDDIYSQFQEIVILNAWTSLKQNWQTLWIRLMCVETTDILYLKK